MRRERQIAVLERLLAVVAGGSDPRGLPSDDLPQGSTVEVARYTSPERLADEKRVLFRELPIAVARAADVAEPGSYVTHDATGVPILVARVRAGEVRGMLNACGHRGTRLVHRPSGHA